MNIFIIKFNFIIVINYFICRIIILEEDFVITLDFKCKNYFIRFIISNYYSFIKITK